MKTIFLPFLLMILYFSRGTLPAQPFNGIVNGQLVEDMTAIAADETEDRFTASPGFDKAAAYVGKEFKKAGLEPGWTMEEVTSNCDSWPFIQRHIPSAVLGSGGFPEHHTTEDKINLIDFDHLEKSMELLTSLVRTIAEKGFSESGNRYCQK